jgi:hypothetical protein
MFAAAGDAGAFDLSREFDPPSESVQKLQMALHAKAKAEAGYRFYALYDKISREDILAHAYAQCRSNKGASRVDDQNFADIEAYGVERWLGELARALRDPERASAGVTPLECGLSRYDVRHKPLLCAGGRPGSTHTDACAIEFRSSSVYDTIFASIFRSLVSACPSTLVVVSRRRHATGMAVVLSRGGSHGCQEKVEVREG